MPFSRFHRTIGGRERRAEALIIFDLEWNSGLYDGIRLDEILQIGAVKCDRPGGQVEDVFCVYIRPKVHRRFSPAAGALPELEEAKRSRLDFPSAARAFFRWCGKGQTFATWGGNDFLALRENLEYWKLKELALPETFVDLQIAFDASVGAANSVSLERAVEYCRVPDVFDPHNALSDAIYTWAVCAHLGPEDIARAAREPAQRRARALLPRRKTPWQGPFEGAKAMLNNRGCRRATCPVCGERVMVDQWFSLTGGGPYYARFICPQDGQRLWKLETARDKKGMLWANGAAAAWSPQNKEAFQAAKAGAVFSCRSKKRRGRSRYRRGGKQVKSG